MSKQIAVRLPDDLVDFLDELVASGEEASRASIVTRALKREKRRLGTLKDVETLKRFLNPNGRILSSRRTGLTAKNQRSFVEAVKRARFMALLPFIVN